MKAALFLSLVLAVSLAQNIRGSTRQNLVELETFDMPQIEDLSGNLGVVKVQEVEVAPPLTKQQAMILKAEHKETNAIHRALQHSDTQFNRDVANKAKAREAEAIKHLFEDEQISFMQIKQEVEENTEVAETAEMFNNNEDSPAMGQDPIIEESAEAPMMISVDLDQENSQDIQVTTEEAPAQFNLESQVDALFLVQVKQEESNESENSPTFVEETLDQMSSENIQEVQDIYTNDGQSPSMGQPALFEDAPEAPMMILMPEDTDYVRAIDQLDLVNESGEVLIAPQDMTFFIQMGNDDQAFDESMPLFGDDSETPRMQEIPEQQMAPMAEAQPQSTEASPGLDEIVLERETEEMVESLMREEALATETGETA